MINKINLIKDQKALKQWIQIKMLYYYFSKFIYFQILYLKLFFNRRKLDYIMNDGIIKAKNEDSITIEDIIGKDLNSQ